MRARWLLVSVAACGAAPPASAPVAGNAGPPVVPGLRVDDASLAELELVTLRRMGDDLLIESSRGEPRRDATYLVVGSRPPVRLRVRGPAIVTCSHCGDFADVVVDAGTLADAAEVALGPVAAARRWAPRRVPVETAPPPLSDRWRATDGLDLDGDDLADLMIAERCGRWVPSGCGDAVCARVCHALVRPDDGRASAEACDGFVPDVADCIP